MKKPLGDILLARGYLSSRDLDKALAYQMKKILGDDCRDDATSFLLDVARTKYNQRDAFYLGRILTELKLLPEHRVREALDIQAAAPPEKPRGRLDALNRILVRMNSSYSLIDLLHQILVLAAQVVEAESASLIIHDHRRDTLVILMPTGPGAEAVRDLEIPKNKGIVGWVYGNSQSVISNDTAADDRFYAAIDAASGYTSRQVLCVPLTVKEKRLGAIEAINKLPVRGRAGAGFTAADRFLLELFSAQAAVAIENTRLAVSVGRLEEDLRLHAAEAARAQASHAAGMVADSLFHEMEKSLLPLKGYAARMRETAGDQRIEKYGAYIDKEMGRLMGLAESLGHFLADRYAPVQRPFDLRDALKELESRTWVDCRLSGIAFAAEVSGDLRLEGDKELLLLTLENLFRNSRDAMPEGGSFSISACRTDPFTIEMEIRDCGEGIEAIPMETVFEPFYSKGKQGAAGLGLSIAKKIVELHGGIITVGSRSDGRGAAFRIVLPVGRENPRSLLS
jgi:signal transduction histidine kinase